MPVTSAIIIMFDLQAAAFTADDDRGLVTLSNINCRILLVLQSPCGVTDSVT
ncbi:MAG: hypothetical protein GQ565_01975 [Candidatus Aegiribacteria sp.]|nr:hypothetical protein [Candidatus Aegiribacteria sp.]